MENRIERAIQSAKLEMEGKLKFHNDILSSYRRQLKSPIRRFIKGNSIREVISSHEEKQKEFQSHIVAIESITDFFTIPHLDVWHLDAVMGPRSISIDVANIRGKRISSVAVDDEKMPRMVSYRFRKYYDYSVELIQKYIEE